MGFVVVGVDVGQRVDPTAICVADAEWRPGTAGTAVSHFPIRFLERLPLGTPYPAVARRVAAVVAGVVRQRGVAPKLFVDATGVGTPVVDELRAAGVRALIFPVYFTYGDRRSVDERQQVSLGKAWLVSRLQAMLQGGRLHLSPTAESQALAKELLDYEIQVDPDANDRYGAFKTGAHDDLVTAVGLATQEDPGRPFSAAVAGERRLFDPWGPPMGGGRPSYEPGELTIEEMRRRGWVR